MSDPRELSRVEAAHRAAQARLGLAGAYLVLRDWGAGAPSTQVSTGWISPALRVINALRKVSVKLARRYYRLARAIETGTTLGHPDTPVDGSTVAMEVLRTEFLEVLQEIAEMGNSAPPTGRDPDVDFLFKELVKEDPRASENGRLELMESVDLPSYIEDWEAEHDRDAGEFIEIDDFDWDDDPEDEAEVLSLLDKALENDVVKAANDRIRALRDSETAPGAAMDQLVEQQQNAGSIAAGRVDRFGIAAGRSEIDRVIPLDRRVKKVARGLGPNPCNFCAMLASRGFVYKDKRTANLAGGADSIRRYHDNCHCYPIVRWVDASEVPPANLWLQGKWYEVTRGTHGHDMRLAWRRWYDTEGRQELRKYLDGLEDTQAA